VDGFTPEQRFFLGFARSRANNTTPEALRVRINTDPHPASKYRVNGPLSNMPQFATAFGCRANDAMVRAERCDIW
jgi:putative endopeptidase